MSAGHRIANDTGLGEKDLDRVLRDPKIDKALGRNLKIDSGWDIPYLAGYSKSGLVIYIDRHLPKIIKIGKRNLWTVPPLIRHERLEKVLEDIYGYEYPAAHQLATLYEHRLVKKMLGSINGYEAALKPYIKADEKERLVRVPKDLDRQPYLTKPIDEELVHRLDEASRHPAPK